jgi:uncharacterized protein (DUF488 family)
MICHEPKAIHTIGHSTRTIAMFIELLKAHRIELLLDVRRWPMSKRHPHFNREALSASLEAESIGYNLPRLPLQVTTALPSFRKGRTSIAFYRE